LERHRIDLKALPIDGRGDQGYDTGLEWSIIKVMLSLIAVLGVFAGNAVLASRYGADSRRHDDRPNW
jgi:hypothetical protein